MQIINLEAGMPSTIDAMTTLNNRLYAVRATGVRTVKIIHGYGSTGRGGTIRKACRQKLLEYRRRHVIKDLCAGERFGPFDEEGRRLAALCPEVRSDSDWGRHNDGVTVVLFK
ncbi:MAG: Smr/MutS family protein [Clostridiales bacterium]|nr:Smr/MutS family protein [Clostridiales bacterium]